jgi:membrane fusion protein, multidrug efflux system
MNESPGKSSLHTRAFGPGIPVLAATWLLLLLTACQQSDLPVEQLLRPVRFFTVADDQVGRNRSFSGTSKSTQESRLSFKVAGTVTSVPAQIGQQLKKGDLIAQLDAANFMLQVEQAQASLAKAQAGERNANSNYERTKGLYANDNASLNELDSSRAGAESAKAQVRAAGKALEIARLNESYTRLYASAICSIASIDIEINENVTAGRQIAIVSCGDEFEVLLDVPESIIAGIDQNTPVSIFFSAISGVQFSGTVTKISTAGSSAAFPVVVHVNEKHPALRSGLAAEVTFQFDLPAAGGSYVLPVAAIIHDPGGTFVYIAEPGGTQGEAIVTRRAVTLGELTRVGIEVLEGLSPGDRVITAGVSVIREGQRVLIP